MLPITSCQCHGALRDPTRLSRLTLLACGSYENVALPMTILGKLKAAEIKSRALKLLEVREHASIVHSSGLYVSFSTFPPGCWFEGSRWSFAVGAEWRGAAAHDDCKRCAGKLLAWRVWESVF